MLPTHSAASRSTSHMDDGDSESPTPPSLRLQTGRRPSRRASVSTQSAVSPSVAQRIPTRSFYHLAFHGSLDPVHYSSHGLRQQTAELASLAISESAFDTTSRSYPEKTSLPQLGVRMPQAELAHNSEEGSGHGRNSGSRPEDIQEVSEPTSLQSDLETAPDQFKSALTKMIQRSPPDSLKEGKSSLTEPDSPQAQFPRASEDRGRDEVGPTEETPLILPRQRVAPHKSSDTNDLEGQQTKKRAFIQGIRSKGRHVLLKSYVGVQTLSNPKRWDARAIWQTGFVHPVSVLPAVFLGLLLNILDALSYGMILFPLGQPLFADMGSDGISMFYISTIISQLVFSSGGSIFKGAVGSEMIEIVPFMHKMAYTILHKIGEDDPKAVLATTVLAFSASSVLTGIVFFLMGACRLGSLIGFFPRHILIGCIGGVGFFLVITGLEVSAGLAGNLNYDLSTLHKLFELDTVFLWTTPLLLAVTLKITQRFIKSHFLVGTYFIGVGLIFYFFTFALGFPLATLRDHGWIFDAPPAGKPWYHFYSLYDIHAVNWEAFMDTIPAMFALTFFGVLHVPINVPALSISTGEDNLNLDRELLAHGVTNALSGFFGSIQNYLVYTNSLLFIDSGGDSRLAGILLAVATTGILFVGPVLVGYIPVLVVGALIFLLGIELLEEALVDTWGRLHRLEYITVLIIVVTMGGWDFVVGILVGIVLACVNFVVQTSRKSAVRATYSGQIANSTVRRPPMQLKFLKEAGQQTYVIKLAGFLFFGTIVGVENRIRALLAEDAFHNRPIRYLILDLAHINGVDFSAAEAFTRISRLLKKRDVVMVVSGVNMNDEVGQSLSSVGLFSDDSGVELFKNLNQALEYCENNLLQALYQQQARLAKIHGSGTSTAGRTQARSVEVPRDKRPAMFPAELMFSSPRRHQLHKVASSTLEQTAAPHSRAWNNYKQPLPLLLQIFEDVSEQGETFWFRASRFFERKQFPAGTVVFTIGDAARGFYLLEEGILRADHDSPQGQYSELIVAGRPCGELPFFSETSRTATMTAERDCVVWELSEARWTELEKAVPDVANEMLKICLLLTKERMESVLGYILTAAG